MTFSQHSSGVILPAATAGMHSSSHTSRASRFMASCSGPISPLQDAMNNKARKVWLLECIPAVAAGAMTPEECWKRVMALRPFSE